MLAGWLPLIFIIVPIAILIFMTIWLFQIPGRKKESFACGVFSIVIGVIGALTNLYSPIKDFITEINETQPASISISEESITEQPQPPVSVAPSASSTDASPQSGVESSATQTEGLQPGDKKQFSGALKENQSRTVTAFITPVEGTYRFDLDISDVTCDYKVILINEKGKTERSVSSSSEGFSIDLPAGQSFRLSIEQTQGSSRFKILLHVPNAPKKIQ